MSDDHKVNEVLDSEMKDLLLTWLFKFGRDCVKHDEVWDYLLDEVRPPYPIADTLNSCFDSGYLDNLQDPFTRQYNHRLTDAGLEFLNEQRS